jgi:hypothetical protein
MKRSLQFVDHGDGEILHRNPAVAGGIDQELVTANPELSGALTGLHLSGRREKCPFEIRFFS